MNAWAGFVLLGEATNNTPLRDFGIWLFTTELAAIEDYWFGVHGDTFPTTYPASVVTMVWGGKGANATWFSGDPEMVHGINWLPFTGASLYLGRFPDYTRKNYEALVTENLAYETKQAEKKNLPAPADGKQWSGWADLIWMYRAFSDPADAMTQYEAALAAEKTNGKFPLEAGNGRAALAHWIYTISSLGAPDRTVTADTPLYAVLTKNGKRSYAAFNGSGQSINARFSDGTTLPVAAHSSAIKSAGR
jgi:endoglucanase Acf2